MCVHMCLGKYVWMLCASDLCPGPSVIRKEVPLVLKESFLTAAH